MSTMETPRTAILVTGLRALDVTAGAESWARILLQLMLTSRDRPTTLVVTGGCPRGPDAWTREAAQSLGIRWREYRLDGLVWEAAWPLGRWAREGDSMRGPRWPLLRNERMVEHIAAGAPGRYDLHALALVAPWSTTHGAAFTARKCREAGFVTSLVTCPREHAPRVDR